MNKPSNTTRREHQPRKNESRHQPLFNSGMMDGLAVLRQQSLAHASPEQRAPRARAVLGPIPAPNKDGFDHVNFSNSAKTELGQLLNFDNTLRFFHPGLGLVVPSIFHFWVFLQSGGTNPNIFKLETKHVQGIQNKFSGSKQVYVANQYALLAQAYWYKFKEHDLLAEVLAQFTGRFDYYLDDRRGVRRPMSAAILVDIMNSCRSALADGREIDLLNFMDLDTQLSLRSNSPQQRSELLLITLEDTLKTARQAAEEQAAAAAAAKQRPPKQNHKPKPTRQNSTPSPMAVVPDTPRPNAVGNAPSGDELNLVREFDENRQMVGTDAVQEQGENLAQPDAALQLRPFVPDLSGESEETQAAAPAAPAAAPAPAAPVAPAGGAAPQAPAAPAAPTAQAEGEEQADGRVLDIGAFHAGAVVGV